MYQQKLSLPLFIFINLTTLSPAGGNDAELVEAAEKFTNLTGLATDMWKVSTHGISAIARNMGTNLLDLRVMECERI